MTRAEAFGQSSTSVDLSQPDVEQRAWEQAMDFIVMVLGSSWLDRELRAAPGESYLLLTGDSADDDFAAYLRMHRTMLLAWELDTARRIRGFDHLVKALRARTSYEAVDELRAMNHMSRAGQASWFMDPNAHDGPAYDAVVVLSGHEVAVEVKAKESKAVHEFRPSLIENPLRKARSQLPAAGPGIVYLQVASPWSDDEEVLLSIEKTVKRTLANSRRLNAVVLMLERTWVRENGNRSFSSGTLTIPNQNPHIWVPDIQDWLLESAPDSPDAL